MINAFVRTAAFALATASLGHVGIAVAQTVQDLPSSIPLDVAPRRPSESGLTTSGANSFVRGPSGGGFVWGGALEMRLKSDQMLNRAGGAPAFNNTFVEIDLGLYANFGQHFSIVGLFKLEQLRSEEFTGAFRNQGAYVEQLYGTARFDPVEIYAGKIHPHFGIAWDATPGLYGTDFAEDYELVEKLGFGVSVGLPLPGRHRLAFEAFFADISFLSTSIITRPMAGDPNASRLGRARFGDGGVSNTGRPNNFAVSLEGGHIPDLPGFSYALGWSYQRGSQAGGELNEMGWVAGMTWEIPLGRRMTITPLVEVAGFRHFQGTDQRALFATLGAELRLPLGWAVAAFGTIRDLRESATLSNRTAYQAGASVSYDLGGILLRQIAVDELAFLRSMQIQVGVKREVADSVGRWTAGVELGIEKRF